MTNRLRELAIAIGVAALVGVSHELYAQPKQETYHLRYNSGQQIQPVFEGWTRNADGTFAMHFGYLNRNYVEEVAIPVGSNNSIEPGGPDQGQPSYFYPRIGRRQFSVNVPKDFGKKELIWTIVFRGEPLKAVAWLQPEWEIASPKPPAAREGNTPPVLGLDASYRAKVDVPFVLAASLSDDGLPKRAPAGQGDGTTATRSGRKPAVGQETPPILQPAPGNAESPVNVPWIRLNPRGVRITPRPPQGASVTYVIWRAPAAATSEPLFAVPKDGKAETTFTFTVPGDYVVRARATDGNLSAQKEIKITVQP